MKVKYFAVGLLVISAALWLTAGGGSQQIFNDGLFKIYSNVETTRRIKFDAHGVADNTTRTIYMPNQDVNLGELGGGGFTKWDDIGNPDAADEIDFASYIAELNIEDFRIGDGGSNYVKFNGTPLITFVGNADIDLPNNSVDNADMSDNSVDSDEYVDDSIDDAHINWGTGAGQVNPADFADQDIGDIDIITGTWSVEPEFISGKSDTVVAAGDHFIFWDETDSQLKKYDVYSLYHDAFSGFLADEHIDWTDATASISTSGTITGSYITGLTGGNFGNLSLANGSITDSSGAISFGNENLSTTGTGEFATITEGGNAVYNATEVPGGELGGSWASPTIDDGLAKTNWNLTTPTITTQFTITAQDDPTTDADGEFALDTDGWGSGYDAYEVYNGTHSAYIVATQASDNPGNGQVPKWNTGGSITWEDDLQGAGGGDPVLIDATAITDGAGIDLKSGTGVNISLNQTPSPDEATFNFAASEITGGTTWDDGGEASVVWQWDLTAGDPAITFGNGVVNISSGALQEGGNAVWNAGETDIIDSQHYVAGSIDHEHLADDIISGASAVGTFESGDKILVLETGVGLRQADYDDLPGGGAGDSIKIDTVDVTDPDFQSTGDIDFIDTSNIVTANINTDAVDDTHIDWGTSAGQVNPADFVDQDIGDIDIATGVWTIEPEFISGKSDVTGDSADYMLIWDNSDSQLKKIDLGEVLGGGGGNYLTDNAADEMVAATDGVTELIIRNTDNSLAAETYLLELQHTADGSTNGDFIKCTDAYGGTPATLFDVDYQGNVTALTSLVAPKLVGYGDSDTYWQLAANTHKFYAADNLITSQSWGIGGFFSVNSDNLNVDFRYNGDTSNYVVIMDGTNENVVINGGAPATFSANFDLGLCGDGVLCLKETTTPTADTGYGKLYTKNDNKLYFQDGDNGESFLWRDSDTDIIDDTHINWGSLSYLGEEGAITVTDSTSATCYVALWETATGDLPAFSDGGLTYNASTANLSTTTFTGALSGNATTCTTASAGDAAADFFGAGVHAVTDGTACTDIEGTGLSISASTLNWSAASTDLTDTADLLYETELDEFSELQSQIADKTLVNTADGATWSGTHDFKSATVKLPARVIFCFNIRDIDDGFDDIKMTFPSAMTITQVTAYVTGGTNVVGRLYEVDGDGDDGDAVGVETSDWTFTTGETEDTSFNNATFDAGDYIQWDTTSVSGSVTNFSLTVWGYET